MGWGQRFMFLVLKAWTDCVCLSVGMFGRSYKTLMGQTFEGSSKCGSSRARPGFSWSPSSLTFGKGEVAITEAGLLRSSTCIIIYGKLCKLKLPLKSIMFVTIWSLPPSSPLSPEVVFLFSFRSGTTFIRVRSPLSRAPRLARHSAEHCRRWRWWKHHTHCGAPITLLLCDMQTFSQAIIMPSNAVLLSGSKVN